MRNILKHILFLATAVIASGAAAQEKPFFSAQYPSAGVSLTQGATTSDGQNSAPKIRSSRVVSSDDFQNPSNGQAPTGQTPRPPNLTQFGVEFDKRHPELWEPQEDLETVKARLEQGQASPTPCPTATPTPTPSPTPIRIKIGRRVYIVNSNATLQPAANPSATPIPIGGVVLPQR